MIHPLQLASAMLVFTFATWLFAGTQFFSQQQLSKQRARPAIQIAALPDVMVRNVVRLFVLMLSLAIVICPLARAYADDAKDKPVNAAAEPAAQPKIRVILPALWESAIPQTTPQAASPQRSAAR